MTTILYRGQKDVALWTGVTSPAVANWMQRFEGEFPEPDAEISNEGGKFPIRGWLPERKPEWVAFAAARLGPDGSRTASATSARAIRRAAAVITRQAEAGEITERAAIELLAALIGTVPLRPPTEGPS